MRIGNWYFEFYNVRKHRPTLDLDGIDFGQLRFSDDGLRFAEADMLGIIMMVTNRMANVVYHSKIEYVEVNRFFDFLNRDILKIICRLFVDGYVDYDIKDGRIAAECGRDDYDTRKVVRFYDTIFREEHKTQKEILRPYLDMLDTVNNSDLNLMKNYGAMGVLSPENSSMSDGVLHDEARKELQDDYRKNYGITFGRWGLLITRKAVKFTPISLPIKELEIPEKRKSAIASILQFMNIPKELHALFESAKYANRNEAELDMYGNKITATAAMMVDFCEKFYRRLQELKGRKIYLNNEFWFDIVNVPALQEAQRTERETAREELKFWQEMKAEMPEKSTEIEQRINDLLNRI